MTMFGPEDLRARSRESFVGNECDTDEYGESQPEKGEAYLARALEIARHPATIQTLRGLAEKWRSALGGRYDGADELRPILEILHDLLWERGEHPYYGDVAELREFLDD
jgi:hypothetical protein